MAKRILVVEDEQDHRELLKLIFSVHGYEVDTAASAHEAVEIFAQRKPDLAILDVMLPDKDGWALCQDLKMVDPATAPPIMMLSASAHMEARFDESCADDMLTKPFDDDELLAKVRHLLGDIVSK
ncbi:MAG TPA: response regulator transcription factor [Armatimonadota bacterium]|jgi:two-component system response regulator ResD